MWEEARDRLDAGGTFLWADWLREQADAEAAADTIGKLIRYLYWQRHDLPAVVTVGSAGIHYCLQTAAGADIAAETAARLRGIAKAAAYDLGSFTWRGWDEAGIAIDPTSARIGYECARLNLQLAQHLRRGDLPLSRAYWLLGVHLWDRGETVGAREALDAAATYAEAAGARAEQLLADGFSQLIAMLAVPGNSAAALEATKAELAGLEDGPGFATQLDTAARVYRIDR